MKIMEIDQKYRDYLDRLRVDYPCFENPATPFPAYVKANITFREKLENFKQFIDCLTADRCFALWIRETEELLIQSEVALCKYSNDHMSKALLVDTHDELSERIRELAGRIYEGHWEYGLSEEADEQFDDLTELCRRIWLKESKAWLSLARAWKKV
ncbi:MULTISPECIES: hypothetical protein [Acinetobacter]|uniref:hypothetical protein n=1 Tax=Acinetobacter TaxID=469 RepID=UPI0007D0AD48|nr:MULTISPECIES: hypothetical protein [Acinetobacter]OAL85937.1 hypothetical protein AY605_14495 [Acinetobacter sp. SFD]